MNSVKLAVIISLFTISGLTLANESGEQIEGEQDNVKSPVTIEWVKPEKFRDVRHPNISRAKYRDSVFKELESHFVDLAENLPEGYNLALKVTNLDMAGEVQTGMQAGISGYGYSGRTGFQEYRIVRQIDIPRMTISYELSNAKGEVIQAEDEVKVKDVGFLNRYTVRFKNKPLRYEKTMLTRWFKNTFLKAAEA